MGRRTGFILGGAALLLLVVLASALSVQSLHLDDSHRAGTTGQGAREGVHSPLKERHGLRHRRSDRAPHRDGTEKVDHRDGGIEEAVKDGETKSGSDSVSDVGDEGREGRQDGMRRGKSDRARHVSRHGGMRKVTQSLSESENGDQQRRSSGPRHHGEAGKFRRHGGPGKLHSLGRRGGVRKQSSLRLAKSQRFANKGMEKVLRRGASDESHRKRAPAAKNDVLMAKEKGGSHDCLRKTVPVAQKGRLGGRSHDSGRKIGSPIVKKGGSRASRRHRISAANNVRLVGEKRAQDSHRHHSAADNGPRHLGRQGGIKNSIRIHSLSGIRHGDSSRGTARTLQQSGTDKGVRHGGQRRGTARISQHGGADRIYHLARHSDLKSRVSHGPVHHNIGRFASRKEGSQPFDRKGSSMSNIENTEEVVKSENTEDISQQFGTDEVHHHRAGHSGLKSRVSHRPEHNVRLNSGRFALKKEASHAFGRKRARMSKVENAENTEEIPDVTKDETVNEVVVMNVTIVEPAMKNESSSEVVVTNDTTEESVSKNKTIAEEVLKRAEEVLTFVV